MRKLNVLSIDWDYFVNASAEKREDCFPDGNECLPSFMQDSIWARRYVDSKEMADVAVDNYHLNQLLRVLKSDVNFLALYYVTESHGDIYAPISDLFKEKQDRFDGINLVNIDFHHDLFFGSSNKPDCGNWLRLLMQELNERKDLNNTFTWVARKDSQLPENQPDLKVVYDLKLLKKRIWDVIFICRSDMWSPPHLDPFFISSFVNLARRRVKNSINPHVEKDRYSTEFLESAKELRRQYENFFNSRELLTKTDLSHEVIDKDGRQA